jgi:hypothetical protein
MQRRKFSLAVRQLFEGPIPVMPAQAGIQRFLAQASGECAWIPAFEGMTPPQSLPQNHRNEALEPEACSL